MDGTEPRMFPGVVMNRHRRSSVQRPSSGYSDLAEGSGQSWGMKSEVGEAVIEEPEEVSSSKRSGKEAEAP